MAQGFDMPDTTWQLWTTDRADYLQKFVYQGRFHAGVHEDVVKDYRIAEHIMAQAWYYYPMYDEALRKLLGTTEMAIKLRAKEVGIRVTKRTRLQELIDSLFPLDKGAQFNAHLHRLRSIRNRYAYPEHYSFGAITIQHIIVPLVNTLNRVFLPLETIEANKEYVEAITDQVISLNTSACILEWNGGRYLIREAVPRDAHKVDGNWVSCWIFHPVFNNAAGSFSKGKYPPPIVLSLVNAEVTEAALIATDVVTQQPVQLVPTVNILDLTKLAEHNKAWEQASEEEQMVFRMAQGGSVSDAFHEAQYRSFWTH